MISLEDVLKKETRSRVHIGNYILSYRGDLSKFVVYSLRKFPTSIHEEFHSFDDAYKYFITIANT
jgi:hypothetical protein